MRQVVTVTVAERAKVLLPLSAGFGDFTPGIERMRKAGYKVDVAPYPEGLAGVKLSLDVIAKKIRDGRLDADIRGWVGDVLQQAGNPKSRRAKVQAILDAFRKATVYVPDPAGAEYIVSAAGTACLRPGLCVRARDCDDGVVFMGSALLSIGIPVVVVKQNFGPGKQEHVLVEFQDESGSWLPADPSTELDAGSKVPAVSEERIDPMTVVGSSGTSGPEIVTLGFVESEARDVHFDEDRKTYVERRYGKLWVYQGTGLGWAELEQAGVGDACCAACAAGAKKCPCEDGAGKVGDGSQATPRGLASETTDAPCSSCEAFARRLRAAGMAGVPTASAARTVAKAFNPFGMVKVGLGQSVAPSSVGVGTVIATMGAMALAAGIGWGIAKRKAA
jgi:hypothetical protein